jgi:RNA polymerase sigma-70 factor (ECF subfamily)
LKGSGHHAETIDRAFERCSASFYRYFAVRLRDNGHLVDDLMQQLWLQARSAARGAREIDPEPWLWRIAQNLVRQHRRKVAARGSNGPLTDAVLARSLGERLDTEDLPDEVLARKEVQEQLLLALSELPSAEQELLIGFYFDGHPQARLAEMFGLTERAVEGRLYRARLALRDRLTGCELNEDRA